MDKEKKKVEFCVLRCPSGSGSTALFKAFTAAFSERLRHILDDREEAVCSVSSAEITTFSGFEDSMKLLREHNSRAHVILIADHRFRGTADGDLRLNADGAIGQMYKIAGKYFGNALVRRFSIVKYTAVSQNRERRGANWFDLPVIRDTALISESPGCSAQERLVYSPDALMMTAAACAYFETFYADDPKAFLESRCEKADNGDRDWLDGLLGPVGAAAFPTIAGRMKGIYENITVLPDSLYLTLRKRNVSGYGYKKYIAQSSVTAPLILYAAEQGVDEALDILLKHRQDDPQTYIAAIKSNSIRRIAEYILENSYCADNEHPDSKLKASTSYMELMLMINNSLSDYSSYFPGYDALNLFWLDYEYFMCSYLYAPDKELDIFKKARWWSINRNDRLADLCADVCDEREEYLRAAKYRFLERRQRMPDYNNCAELAGHIYSKYRYPSKSGLSDVCTVILELLETACGSIMVNDCGSEYRLFYQWLLIPFLDDYMMLKNEYLDICSTPNIFRYIAWKDPRGFPYYYYLYTGKKWSK